MHFINTQPDRYASSSTPRMSSTSSATWSCQTASRSTATTSAHRPFLIASNSKYPEEVAKFINFFVNDLEATKIFNMELGAVGPKHVSDDLLKSVDRTRKLMLEDFNTVTQALPPKTPDPKGTTEVLAAHKRANEAVRYGKTVSEAVDTFLKEAKEAYKVNVV